jgi:hypothetical protein
MRCPQQMPSQPEAVEIWPKLRSLQVIALVRATGLTYGYCNQINLGHVTTHPRWWDSLNALV